MRLPPKSGAAKTAVETRRCAIYTRKSTSVGLDQDFNSLDAQREACLAYIQRQPGWTLVEMPYDDGGYTGANIDRPAFQRLLADIDGGRVDVVVVYKVDRLSRSLLDFAKVMERFNAAGASFVSVTQNFSTADAMGRLTLNMLMSFAEFEREMISERTRDKIAAARRRGKWTGGPVPLGYSVVDKKLVVNELEAVLAREIFALYHEHRSTLMVARVLNQRQELTKRHRAQNGHLRQPRTWAQPDVVRILKNPVYAGYMAVGDELFEAEHPPIIERSVFLRTQELLKAATRDRKIAPRNAEYLLRGLLRCACCGAGFTTASTTTRGILHRYYRCISRDRRGKEACPSAPMPAQAIEDFVVKELRDAVARGGLVAELTAAVCARVASRRDALGTERKELPRQIAGLSGELQRGAASLENLTGPARRAVETQLEEVGKQLARHEAAWVANCLTDFHRIWDVLTPENRARLARAVIERVEVNEPANEVHVFVADLAGEEPTPAAASVLAQAGEAP